MRVWAMRGTLHLLATEDLSWQVPLFAERELAWGRRRLAEGFGIDRSAQDRAARVITRMLAEEGRVARKAVLDRLAETGMEFDRASAGHHLSRLPVLEGTALLGPEEGRETTYVVKENWIDRVRPLEREAALAELARRYLGAFGPAGDRDMSAWSGLGLRDCRAGLASIGGGTEEVSIGGERLLALRGATRRLPRAGLTRMLPAFDNHYLAHRDRAFAIDSENVARVWPGGGIIRPTIAVDGRAVATWRTRRDRGHVHVSVDPFAPLSDEAVAAVEVEVADIGRFEGLEAAVVATIPRRNRERMD